jgi:hypothetical protein
MIVERGSLIEIAARMQNFAWLNPYARGKPIASYRQRLPRGLEITLLLNDEQDWYLEIARGDVMPSEQEEQIIKRAFGVPEYAERAEKRDSLNGRAFRCAIRWIWAYVMDAPE